MLTYAEWRSRQTHPQAVVAVASQVNEVGLAIVGKRRSDEDGDEADGARPRFRAAATVTAAGRETLVRRRFGRNWRGESG